MNPTQPIEPKKSLANKLAEKLVSFVLDPAKQTFIVIGPGYYGVNKNLVEAAQNCKQAGCPLSAWVCVVQIIGDDSAKFLNALQIEYAHGAHSITIGTFKLGPLCSGRKTRV